MYVRQLHGVVLEFGHRGWLLDESFIFYDRQYDSLWVQATGQCIDGKFKGERLEAIPATHTTWGQWSIQHPETLVLAKPRHLIERYRRDSYAPAYERWGTEFGLAVFTGASEKLYPFKNLQEVPVVADKIGDQPVLIVFHKFSGTALAFDPTVRGQHMEFEYVETTAHDVVMRDRETGTMWSGLAGRASGEVGTRPQLRQLRTTQFVVSKWPNHFPGAAVFGTP